MWLTKVDFLFAILNKTYNKNLHYLSLWVFDNIPCMNLVKTWVINTSKNPRVGPRVAPLSPNLVHIAAFQFSMCSTLLCLLFICSTSMTIQRVYLQCISLNVQQIALISNRLPHMNNSFLQHGKRYTDTIHGAVCESESTPHCNK